MGGDQSSVVESGGPAIARGDENRGAFDRGLLIGGKIGGVRCLTVDSFALTVADADDGRRRVAVDQILESDQATERGSGISAGSHLNGGARSGGAGPFRIQNRFGVIRGDNAGRQAVVVAARRRRMERGERRARAAGKSESGAKSGPVGGGKNVGVFDEDDRLALAGMPELKRGFRL